VPFLAEISWNIGITKVTNTEDVHWLTIAYSAVWFSTRRALYPFYFLKILFISLQRGISKIYSQKKRLTKKRSCVIKFFSSEKYILLGILATWAIICTLFVIFNSALPFDWSNFFPQKNPKFLGFAYFNYYKKNKSKQDYAVWWSLVYDIMDCGFTAAAAIIVVKSDRDLNTDSEVKLWISMLWVYMMYTYLPTVFFGDA
jgi:hypothetical protein